MRIKKRLVTVISAVALIVALGLSLLSPAVALADIGDIASPVVDTFEFETSKCKTPDIIYVSGDVYAIAYEGNPEGGHVTTARIITFVPAGEASDSVGIGKDTYTTGETAYATGSGFPGNVTIDVYIVNDRTWTDSDTIPADVGDGLEVVVTDQYGNLAPTPVWLPPLQGGEYDLVFDVNRNGVYDADIDVVDDPGHPGFTVVYAVVGGEVYPINKAAVLMPWIGLAVALALASVFVARFARRRVRS